MKASDRTLTAAEHAVLEVLRSGPAATGHGTEVATFPGSSGPRTIRQVDHTTARRLAKVGLVTIDAGGIVTIVEDLT